MKIAILADPLDNQSAGVHVYTKGMVEALITYNKEHEIVLIREKKDPDVPENIQQIAIPNYRFLLIFAAFRLFIIIPLILRWLKVDAVVEPAHFGPFNLPRRVFRITVIHDLTPLLFPQYHHWHSQILQRILLNRILKKAHLILTVSQNSCEDLKRFFPFTAAKTSVVYPGRDPFFQPSHSPAIMEKLQIDAPYFLSVGTIEPRKNLVLLLEAYQQFRAQNDERILLLIAGGKGWKYQAFYNALNQNLFKEDIILLGYVDKGELPALYTHSLALIYPSIYEGFGLPVLEAMACGAVVICADRSSLSEVGGNAALYFDPENKLDLLSQMEAIVYNKPLIKTKKSLSLQQSYLFSWEIFIKAFLKEIPQH